MPAVLCMCGDTAVGAVGGSADASAQYHGAVRSVGSGKHRPDRWNSPDRILLLLRLWQSGSDEQRCEQGSTSGHFIRDKRVDFLRPR